MSPGSNVHPFPSISTASEAFETMRSPSMTTVVGSDSFDPSNTRTLVIAVCLDEAMAGNDVVETM